MALKDPKIQAKSKPSSSSSAAAQSMASGRVEKRKVQTTFLCRIGEAGQGQHHNQAQSTPKVLENQSSSTADPAEPVSSNSVPSTNKPLEKQTDASQETAAKGRIEDQIFIAGKTNGVSNPSTSSAGHLKSGEKVQEEEVIEVDEEEEDASVISLDSSPQKTLDQVIAEMELPILSSKPILRPLPVQLTTRGNEAKMDVPSVKKALSVLLERSSQCPVTQIDMVNESAAIRGKFECSKIIGSKINSIAQKPPNNGSEKVVVWETLLSSPCLLLQANIHLTAVACADKSLRIFETSTGFCHREMRMDAICCILSFQNQICLAIDSKMELFTWDVSKGVLIVRKSLAALLRTPESRIVHQSVSPKGIPLVVLSTGEAFVYSKPMDVWLVINLGFSDLLSRMVGPMKLISTSVPNGLIAALVAHLPKSEEKMEGNREFRAIGEELQLEALMEATKALDSTFEFRFLFNIYAQKLAEKGKWDKLVEFVQNHKANQESEHSANADLPKLMEDLEGILKQYNTTYGQLIDVREDIDLMFI